ncbi:MAG TPA: ParB/RepB/Spo0J family partition protein [Candidatus Nanopelagicaceae bacterium]|nr:ParB/RepB/Spo0J family partition protein [Candidatus Nanopelagicaceae bacterium]
MSKHRGLGRGLEQLIPPGAATLSSVLSGPSVREIPVASISPNPLQPRSQFDDASLQELSRSIIEYGVLQPLVVEPAQDGYHLVAGERRLRASQLAGLATVPAVIRPAGPDRARLEMALVENLQRRDISPLDEARAFNRLCDEFGLTQEAVAQQLGRSRSAVANTIRLLQATPEVQLALAEERVSAAHVRALLAISEPLLQTKTLAHVVARHLSVRDTERLVARLALRAPAKRAPAPSPEVQALEAALAQRLSTRVKITPRAGGRGRIVIDYFSADELDGLCELFGVNL